MKAMALFSDETMTTEKEGEKFMKHTPKAEEKDNARAKMR